MTVSCWKVRLGVVGGLMTIVFAGFLSVVQAEEPSEEPQAEQEIEIRTDDVLVTSTRLPDVPVEASRLPAKVNVITAEDIKRSGAKTVQEAIQWANNIVMYDQVGNAFEQTIDLRGFNAQPVPSTSVFVDGQRINEPDFNAVQFNLIPFDTIERIEIIPGPATIYGKNALGGVINIITKRGEKKPQATGEVLFGSWGRQRYTINASGPVGKFDYYANFAKEEEEGYRDESDADIERFYGRIGYRPTAETDLTVSYTFVRDHLMQAGTLPLSLAEVNPRGNISPGDFVDNYTNVVRLTGRQDLPLGFSLNVNGFYRDLAQEFFTVGLSSVGLTNSTTESWGGTVQLGQRTALLGHQNNLILGADIQWNDFGSSLVSTSTVFGPFNNRADTNEDILGLYAQDTLNLLPDLILTAGVRYDHDSFETDSEDTFTPRNFRERTFSRTNPRAGLTYLVFPGANLYFNYSQGFRVPSILELSQAVGGFNPNLVPVTSDNFEIGGKARLWNWGEASLTFFHSNTEDEIFFTCTMCTPGGGFDGKNRNIDSTRRRGLEATLKGRYREYFDGIINYTLTEATFESTFNLTNPPQTVVSGSTIPLVPKHRLSLTGHVHPAEGWTLSLIGLYVSEQFYLNDESNSQPTLPGYFLLNGRIAYERLVSGGRLNGFLMFNNMLNQNYYTYGTFSSNPLTGGNFERFVNPAPTFSVYGGLGYRFESF